MRLREKAERAETEKKMVFETLAVAQSLGQKIEYILEMGMDAYNSVVDFLTEQQKIIEGTDIEREVKTFR